MLAGEVNEGARMQDQRGRSGGGAAAGGSGAAPNNSNAAGGGWPLGLQPLHFHIQMMNVMTRRAAARSREHLFMSSMHHHPPPPPPLALPHHQLRCAVQGEASPFFLSTYTPSISSLSSSDLDTESTGSFFPERSTTLGTLIGIHSRSQSNQATTMDNVTTQLLQSKHMTKTQRLHACWCAFTLVMRCACSNSNNVNPSQESLSPSLAHLLELERKAAHTQQLQDDEATLQCETFDDHNDFEDSIEESSHFPKDIPLFDGVGELSHPHSRDNTLFDDDGILPPHPSGAPLKAALCQFSTSRASSSYLSTDWSASSSIVRKRKHYHSSHGRLHRSLCPSFWKPN